MRKSFALFTLLMSSASVSAQTQPAQMGITPTTTPEVLQTLDNTKTWVPIGTVDSTTHKFSVVGGGGGNAFPNHAALLAGMTTQTSPPQLASRQGFYNPGDGGVSAYTWNANSYCPGGTSGSPVAADSITCVLPVGQAPSSAGRYLLQYGPEFDVRQAGLQAGGVFDNSPALAVLLTALGTGYGGGPIAFPAVQPTQTQYYFGSSFSITASGLTVDCGGVGLRSQAVQLIFAAGIDGILQNGGVGANDIRGCELLTQGKFMKLAAVTSGDTTITGITPSVAGSPFFGVGDGVIIKGTTQTDAPLATAVGETVTAIGSGSITLATPVTATGDYQTALWRLPAALADTVTTISGSSTVTTTGGPYLFNAGDVVWSDAFPFGSMVFNTSGSLGAQTLAMANMYSTGLTNATVSHAAGSGKMWLVPAALKRSLAPGKSHQVYANGWPFGISMACSSGGGNNCTSSFDQEFSAEGNLIGRFAAGNNPGGSQDIASFYVGNYRADIMDLGTIGSSYFGELFESAESTAGNNTSITLNCLNENESIFFSIYNDQQGGVCADAADAYNNPNVIGAKMIIGNMGEINPNGALVVDTNGVFAGGQYKFTNAVNASSNCAMAGGPVGYPAYIFSVSSDCGMAAAMSFVWNAGNRSYDLDQWVYGAWIQFPVDSPLKPRFPAGFTIGGATTVPSASLCGSGPYIVPGSNDNAGGVAFGTGTSSCALIFANAYSTNAFCTVTPANVNRAAIVGGYYLSARTTTGFTITVGTSGAVAFYYTCMGG